MFVGLLTSDRISRDHEQKKTREAYLAEQIREYTVTLFELLISLSYMRPRRRRIGTYLPSRNRRKTRTKWMETKLPQARYTALGSSESMAERLASHSQGTSETAQCFGMVRVCQGRRMNRRT